MRERLTDYSLLADGGRAVTLVGAPGPISHQLEFHNSGEQRAILRQATLVSAQIEAAAGQAPGVVMPSVVLHPGQARRVPVRITIPLYTPPGRYDGKLHVGGQTVDVVIHVVERYELEIAPTELVLENRAGDRTVRQLVCTNRGNVPLVFGEIGAVVLDDELTNCRSLRAVTAAWPDEDGQHDAVDRFVDLFVKEGWKKVVEYSGVLRVHTAGGPKRSPRRDKGGRPGDHAPRQARAEDPLHRFRTVVHVRRDFQDRARPGPARCGGQDDERRFRSIT